MKERPIHSGRGRIDIVFYNNAKKGFFNNLTSIHKIHCPYIFIECKNYNKDLIVKDFDQLTRRFSDKRGNFGFITCRKIQDKKKILQFCRYILNDKRGYVIVLEDDDLKNLLETKIENDKEINTILQNKMDELLF